MRPLQNVWNRSSLVHTLRQELQSQELLRAVIAAPILGILEVIYAVSFAPLVFSGELAPYVLTGIGLSLFTSAMTYVIIAIRSSAPGMVSGIQDPPMVILGAIITAIAARFSDSTPASIVLATVLSTIALTSVLTGLCCFLLGRFKLGNLTRFVPYPVINGFFAGVGWLLAVGAIHFMTNLSLSGKELFLLFQWPMLLQWLPGCILGILLFVLMRCCSRFLALPAAIISSIILFYVLLSVTHTSTTAAQEAGLLLPALPSGGWWHPLSVSILTQADWGLIFSQTCQMLAVVLITVMSFLLEASAIEFVMGRDLDLNRELKAMGIANLASGLGGGFIGYHSLTQVTLGYRQLGAKSRLVGILVGLELVVVLFMGGSLIALIPKFVLGGIVVWVGLELLSTWVYDAWFKLPKSDYGIVILILIVIATFGVLPGVAIGLGAAVILFIINYSQIDVTRHTLSGATHHSNTVHTLPQMRFLQEEGDCIHILNLQGFLFFGTAIRLSNRVQHRLQDASLTPVEFLILNFQSVRGIDSSAALSFVKLKQKLQPHEVKLVLTHLNLTIEAQLRQSGCITPDDPVCRVFPDLDRGLAWCETEILQRLPLRRSRSLPLALQLNDLFPNRDHASDFMDYLEEWDVETGTTVFQQHQPVEALYLIELGQVTIYLKRPQAHPYRIHTLGAGNLVGELDFFRSIIHHTSAVVEAPTTLYRLSKVSFQQMQQEKPEVAAAFQSAVVLILSNGLISTYQELADLLGS